jgi:hypothetical protein
MLSAWQTRFVNYGGSGFDVLAISPQFPVDAIGKSAFLTPYWGRGTNFPPPMDPLTVDYFQTASDFWAAVEKYRPIAIMSFSRAYNDQAWLLEPFATNWANAVWTTALDYVDNNGNQQTDTWVPPPVGGTVQDPAPPSQGRNPAPGSPPDPTLFGGAYDTSANPPTDQWLYRRFSTLPVGGIVLAINTKFNGVGMTARINAIGPGDFVSNYMAYLVAWYKDWWSDNNVDPTKRCRCAGTRTSAFELA